MKIDPDERRTLADIKRELETEYKSVLGLEARKEEVIEERKDGEADLRDPFLEVNSVKDEEKARIQSIFEIVERRNEGKAYKMRLKCKDVKPKVEDIHSLSNYIGSELKSLKELKLDLTSCQELVDSDLKYLASKISNLEDLDDLDLNFSQCPNISDLAIKGLTYHFEAKF